MIEMREKVRRNSPQYIEYQFRDMNRQAIDLTDFLFTKMEAKMQGKLYVESEAEFAADRTTGKVFIPRYKFMWAGLWDIQFYAVNETGDRVYGEPIQFTVVKNVSDLDIDQITDH